MVVPGTDKGDHTLAAGDTLREASCFRVRSNSKERWKLRQLGAFVNFAGPGTYSTEIEVGGGTSYATYARHVVTPGVQPTNCRHHWGGISFLTLTNCRAAEDVGKGGKSSPRPIARTAKCATRTASDTSSSPSTSMNLGQQGTPGSLTAYSMPADLSEASTLARYSFDHPASGKLKGLAAVPSRQGTWQTGGTGPNRGPQQTESTSR